MNKNLLVLALVCFACAKKEPVLNSMTLRKKYDSASQVNAMYPYKAEKKVSVIRDSITISRANIPPNLNSFIFSDDGKYFVAFEETEVDADTLYFYSNDGTFLAKQYINIYPNVRFSENGAYVAVCNQFGREVMLYTNKGTVVYRGDYTEMIKDPAKVLSCVIPSETGDALLLNANNDVYVFDVKADRIQSRATVGRVLDGSFYSPNDMVAMIVAPDTTRNRSLIVMSQSTGQVVDEVQSIIDATFIADGFILFTEETIAEYSLQ